MTEQTIGEVGEKELIRTVIKRKVNPEGNPDLAGDDCGVVRVGGRAVCVSTDRVPADLISFRLGLIDHFQLGQYLAVLNLSDLAAMGAEPLGLLLNFGLPSTTRVRDFEALIDGATSTCKAYGCNVLGGDLSSSVELSISATSIGEADYDQVLRRSGALPGDRVYCTGTIGLASTAFKYFLLAKPSGMRLSSDGESLLANQFRRPVARFDEARQLRTLHPVPTCMDNTDGAGQSLTELCAASAVGMVLNPSALPVHEVSRQVASFLEIDVIDVVLGPGADFNLLGTIPGNAGEASGVSVIGEVVEGAKVERRTLSGTEPIKVEGWNYFLPKP